MLSLGHRHMNGVLLYAKVLLSTKMLKIRLQHNTEDFSDNGEDILQRMGPLCGSGMWNDGKLQILQFSDVLHSTKLSSSM